MQGCRVPFNKDLGLQPFVIPFNPFHIQGRSISNRNAEALTFAIVENFY